MARGLPRLLPILLAFLAVACSSHSAVIDATPTPTEQALWASPTPTEIPTSTPSPTPIPPVPSPAPESPTAIPTSPASAPSPTPSNSDGHSYSTAFAEMPTLKSTCQNFVAVAAACPDYPVARGPEVDRCLDAGGEGTQAKFMVLDLKGAGAWKSSPCAPAIERTAPHLKTPNNDYIAILVRSDDSFLSVDIGHEYGHLLFELHADAILPKYLPRDGAPVMTEALFDEALDEEIRLNTQVGQDERADPGSFREQQKEMIPYLAGKGEEFARGFELATYDDENDPGATLEGYLELQRKQTARQAKAKDPNAGEDFYTPLYMKRYLTILWERYVEGDTR